MEQVRRLIVEEDEQNKDFRLTNFERKRSQMHCRKWKTQNNLYALENSTAAQKILLPAASS